MLSRHFFAFGLATLLPVSAGTIVTLPDWWIQLPDGRYLFDPTVSVEATSAGSAAGGNDQARDDAHAKEYDGATTFVAEYYIYRNNDKDKTLDKTRSKVRFKTKTYTDNGTETNTDFTTQDIPIVDAKFNDKGEVESFEFKSEKEWYDTDPKHYRNLIEDNGLSGAIDLKKKAANYKASYKLKSSQGIYTYDVSGKIVPGDGGDGGGGGGGGGGPDKLPEPASWMTMLTGLPAVAWLARRTHAAGL